MENAIDTICKMVCSDGSVYLIQNEQPFFILSVSLGDIIALVGLGLSYFFFWKQIDETRKENKKNLRDTWLLEVIIEPNLEQISDFYNKCIKEVEDDLKQLKKQFNILTAVDFKTSLAQTKRKHKESKKISLEHFQDLIRATEPDLSNEVDDILDKLIDDITSLLDKHERYDESSNEVREIILRNKQSLLSALYKSIR